VKVLMLFPGSVGDLPPLLSSAVSMSRTGATVTVVSARCAPATSEYLRAQGVEVATLGQDGYPAHPVARTVTVARVGWLFRKWMRNWAPDVVWYHGGHAMRLAPLSGPRNGGHVVAHAHELYREGSELDRAQRRACRTADAVVCPELNRIWMLRVRSGSAARFFLAPNDTPPDAPAPRAGQEDYTRDLFLRHGGAEACRRFLIYQGLFAQDRCLTQVISAFRSLQAPGVGLILLGGGPDRSYVQRVIELAASDSRIVRLPRIEPPGHLQVTAGCAGGVLLYAPTELNNVYCAPNKIFEYARAGIPMILPEYPGLTATNREFGLGYTCDPLDPASIRSAMEQLLENRARWSRERASRFLDSVPSLDAIYRELRDFLLAGK
jgi:glycosyltransferase involved in cell wall biosynthesis